MSLVRGDAIHLPLADNTVDLIVTSPPYFALRSYSDGGEHYDGQIGSEDTPQAFLEALWAVTAECRRVLKPSGSLWVNLGDKYAGGTPHTDQGSKMGAAAKWVGKKPDYQGVPAKSLMGLPWRYAIGCIDQLDLILRAEVVWSKPNGLPESVTDRVRRSHEQWFHFTKEPRYFAAVDEVREPHAPRTIEQHAVDVKAGLGRSESGFRGVGVEGRRSRSSTPAPNPLGKLPGSVWTIPSEPLKVPDWLGVDHFAAYPQELPRRIILGWSPSGICVECGEGRRPVVEKDYRELGAIAATDKAHRPGQGNHFATRTLGRAEAEATITGYACACDTPTAPTRPAVVLDPFGGTGTTAMVARALGRYPVHVDLSRDYLRLARWRIYDSGHASKTAERTNRERQGTLL